MLDSKWSEEASVYPRMFIFSVDTFSGRDTRK